MFNISRGVMGDDSPRSPFVPTPFVYEPAQPQKWEYRVERIDRGRQVRPVPRAARPPVA